ncbi:MAG TPA: chemotaxis protein CheW [Rhodocyclaceae bacterium]
MAIDMSQFYQVFFEEAAEHLATMESLLLELDVAAPDPEQLNAVFRAAHSIKGSAGTFGFTDLAEVTHILENLLDQVRKEELLLTNPMIDAFLDAGDILKSMLAAHRGEGSADPEAVEAICVRLRQLTGGDQAPAASAPAPAPEAAATPAAATSGYDIRFAIDDGVAGPVDESLLAELGGLGAVTVVQRPESPDGIWQVRLETEADVDDVRALLEFVVRSDSLRVSPLGSADGLSGASDGAYGFFDEEPQAAAASESTPADDADGAFGFFTPITESSDWGQFNEPVVAASGDDPDGAFGFFDSPAPPAAPAAAAEAETAYGFFEPLPGATSAEALAPTEAPAPSEAADAAPKDDPKGAYGFFPGAAAHKPAPEAAAAAAPASATVTALKPAAAAKSAEPAKAAARPAAAVAGSDATIRVGVEKVDQLINLIGELVITQAMLAQSASVLDPVEFERLHNGLAQLERNTRDLQESVMSIRMMPISVVFSRFPRVVRDLSQKLGKQVELKLIGESTELDKSLIERISDPLTHLVRNSLDHGIEMPEERTAKGKQASGTITLKAYHQSGNIVIEVGDDGAGLNRQKILAKAKERGLNAHDQMTDHEVWQLIFEPGFSTADQVTEVSGRGVGMDVVKRNISAMGGRVEIDSMTGIGTRMTVRLPLTLAILDGMSVAVGDQTYIIPLGYVVESLQATGNMIKSVSGVERLIQVREEYLPVAALYEVFAIPGAITALDKGIMVVLEADGVKAAMFVDALVGQHQVVIKSLEANYRKVPGVSGATIMGDGHVALILDVAALVGMARSIVPAAA